MFNSILKSRKPQTTFGLLRFDLRKTLQRAYNDDPTIVELMKFFEEKKRKGLLRAVANGAYYVRYDVAKLLQYEELCLLHDIKSFKVFFSK